MNKSHDGVGGFSITERGVAAVAADKDWPIANAKRHGSMSTKANERCNATTARNVDVASRLLSGLTARKFTARLHHPAVAIRTPPTIALRHPVSAAQTAHTHRLQAASKAIPDLRDLHLLASGLTAQRGLGVAQRVEELMQGILCNELFTVSGQLIINS